MADPSDPLLSCREIEVSPLGASLAGGKEKQEGEKPLHRGFTWS